MHPELTEAIDFHEAIIRVGMDGDAMLPTLLDFVSRARPRTGAARAD